MGFSQRILAVICVVWIVATGVRTEDAYKYFAWTVTYGTIYPMGVPQQGILINDQFPGPQLNVVTNDNVIINVFNNLNEPFLLSWNGIQQRRNLWQDGVLGTSCPIPPRRNFTYKFQAKDQIGTYFYFPSTLLHKVAGGFRGLAIVSRSVISIPYPTSTGEYTALIGDWYKTNHVVLRRWLDSGRSLGMPNDIHINGQDKGLSTFKVDRGRTYRLHLSNVGLSMSLNFRIQGHKMKLVEVEGSHTVQSVYDSLDLHMGQSCLVLITADQAPKDYYIVASMRFTNPMLYGVALLRYNNSRQPTSGPLPPGPTTQIDWSLSQARSIKFGSANSVKLYNLCDIL